MKLIVGLGNPGREYRDTRHNLGSMVVKGLADDCGLVLKRDSATYCFLGASEIEGVAAALAVPYTYMNLSGQSVKPLLSKYRITAEDILIICDDLDLRFGNLRLKQEGSAGGHRGIESVIKALGSQSFCRLRLGIGRPAPGQDAAEYVLENFSGEEKTSLPDILDKAKECCRAWLTGGTQDAMTRYNAPRSRNQGVEKRSGTE